jgi:5-methylcytosine-specific restriction endonuclease McrA
LKAKRGYIKSRGPGYIPRVLQAPECSDPACGEKPLAKGLCYRHYRAAQRALGVPWACEGNKSFKARAARHGVPYEPVNRLRVFERDRWICGLCGEPVDREDASLDHVVPMSRGGAHSYANTQCSHLLCNIRKGAASD